MSRSPKNPLRPLLEEERQQLMRLSRGQALAASPVARAKAVLAVADGGNYTEAARAAGRQSGDAVAALVARFNVEGLAAVVPRHGVATRAIIRLRNGSGFWRKRVGPRIGNGMGRRCGPCRPCNGHYAGRGCPRSVRIRSGASWSMRA